MNLTSSRIDTSTFLQSVLRPALAATLALISLAHAPARAQQPLAADIYFEVPKGGIQVYTAARDGSVQRLPDATGPSQGSLLASTGNFVFTADRKPVPAVGKDSINTFHRTADGTLHYLTSTYFDNAIPNQKSCGVGFLTLDHTGTTLYADLFSTGANNFCENVKVLSFSINKTTGVLTPITSVSDDPGPNQLIFTGNNTFAYSARCSPVPAWDEELYAFKRLSVGDLQFLGTSTPFPRLPAPYAYCPTAITADPANHLTVALMQANTSKDDSLIGPARLAVFSADANGTLTTQSTNANMVTPLLSGVYETAMDPRGQFLAVAGNEGFQLFHANGALQPTQFSNLIPVRQIAQLAWDKSNHLYGTVLPNQLHIYTVTSSGVSEVAGSPFAMGQNYTMKIQAQGDQLPDVKPPACVSPSGVKICLPSTQSTGSPAFISAAATAVSGYITAMRVYIDGVALVTIPSTTKSPSFAIAQVLSIAPGKHSFTVTAYQNNGTSLAAKQTLTIN